MIQPIINISPETFTIMVLIINGILTPIVCVVGFIGNSVGLWVLYKDPNNRRQTIYTYMFALMTFDNLFLLAGLSSAAVEVAGSFDQKLGQEMLNYVIIFGGYVFVMLKHVSAFLLIVMSYERLMALWKPFRAKDSYLSKHPAIIITIIVVVSAVYIIPFFAGFRIVSYQTMDNITSHTTIIVPGYFPVFNVYTYIETIILHYICPALVFILNVMIIVVYSRHKKQRSSMRMNRSSDNQIKMTVIILFVACTYVILSLPNLFLQTLIFVDDNYSFYGKYNMIFHLFTSLGDLLARINAGTDFFVYVFVSNHYRSVIGTLVCRCCRCCRTGSYRGSFSERVWTSSTRSVQSVENSGGTNARP